MTDEAKPGNSDSTSSGGTGKADQQTLSELLATYEKGGDTTKASDNTALANEVAMLSYENEMNKLIPRVKGNLPVSDDMVEMFINSKAKDSKIADAWDNRRSNPAAWNAIADSFVDEFKSFTKANGIGTQEEAEPDDDKGLAAAVRTARQTAPSSNSYEAVEWGNLSDTEFELKKREVFRLAADGKLK